MVNYSTIMKATYDGTMTNPLKQVFDKPNYLDYANTRAELLAVAASIDMSCLPETHGDDWGISCELYGADEAAEYEELTGLTYEHQVRPPIYPAVTAQMARHTVARMEARNEELNEACMGTSFWWSQSHDGSPPQCLSQ